MADAGGHAPILDACARCDEESAARPLARHLRHMALDVLVLLAPEHDARTVRAAIAAAG